MRGVDAGELLLADRERDRRQVRGVDALVRQLLVERHVGVAVDRRDDRGLLALAGERLDVGDDGLPVGMAERRVGLHDVLVADALGVEEGAQDLVGGARIDVVGAQQHEARGAAAVLAHQVLDRRDRLLVGRGAGVEDVLRALLALVLHRVEQQAVELLEHRQHGLARDRGPAAEHHVDLLALDQLARLLGEQRPVGGRIDDHRLDRPAEQAALLVEVVDQHQHDVLQRRLADRHRAGQGMQDADLDRRVLRRHGDRQHQRRPCRHAGDPTRQRARLCHGFLPVVIACWEGSPASPVPAERAGHAAPAGGARLAISWAAPASDRGNSPLQTCQFAGIRAGRPATACRKAAQKPCSARRSARRVGSEPAHDQHRAEAGRAAAHVGRLGELAGERQPVAGIGGDVDRGGAGARTGKGERQRQQSAGRRGQRERIGPDQPPADAELDAVAQQAARVGLAARLAAEDQHVRGEQGGAGVEVDPQAAPQPRAVEQDRLLRQPFEPGALGERQVDRERRIAPGAAVGLLGGLRGDHRACAGLEPRRDPQRIAADDAAAGVDQHGARRLAGRHARPQHAQRRLLEQLGELRRAALDESQPRAAWRRGGCEKSG